ncbi:unnamed protein product [Pseudo-nitzschia multistriata]|uniref:SGNH hydrolase-type esterase domain-containing protein n=1 Tax=Pseudo-nitzschia multistriata TaxID=183589 RepID=A0A448YWR5_9STRA|nr:unnamed protein product [Pseudo-nitzschia multistriata]
MRAGSEASSAPGNPGFSFSSQLSRTSIATLSFLAMVFVCGTTFFSSAMIHHNVRAGTKASSATSGALSSSFPRRVFCFGDSLTAGTSPPNHDLFPYAKHLEESLNKHKLNPSDNVVLDNIERTVQVRWKGYPGWTAPSLLRNGGLSDIIEKAAQQQQQQETEGSVSSSEEEGQHTAIDLVVVLAGTNDLAHSKDGQSIFESIKSIHEQAFSQGHVHRTIALGIPPSGWQVHSESARSLALEVNSKLESWSATTSTSDAKTVFVPFPIQEYDRNSDLWSPDGLHFSPKGYQSIGESLAPIVADILWNNK